MKRKLSQRIRLVLAGLAISTLPAVAAPYSEKSQYLGVVNGQIEGNSVVKVTRTLPEPVLYRADGASAAPGKLIIRNAQVRSASGGMVYITVRQQLPEEGKETRLTLKTTLMTDGHRTPVVPEQRGEDVVISVPVVNRLVELRTDAPAELEVPANYRGNIQIAMQVERGSVDV